MARSSSSTDENSKRPRLADIARVAGVSIPTVSKVIHQRDEIPLATRQHVQQIMQEMGYTHPEGNASTPAKKRRNEIGLVMGYMNAYSIEIMCGVLLALQPTQFRLVLFANPNANPRVSDRWLVAAKNNLVDGVVVIGEASYFDELRMQQIPFVSVDHPGVPNDEIPSVDATNIIGSRLAIQYLLELGHRRIAFIGGLLTNAVSNDRLAGYRIALDEASIPVDPDLIRHGWFGQQSGYEQTLALLDLPDPPTAIFSGNDDQAIGVYRALHDRGLMIPEQMSVIGFDDIPAGENLLPALTTIRQPLEEMGRIATTMLIRLINGEALDATHISVKTTLIKRASCSIPHRK